MKQFITPLAILLATAPILAATPSVAPPAGTLNMEAYPAGLSSFEILGGSNPITVNRDAEGFVTLYLDGEVVRQIPASNLRDVYTFVGYQKGIPGDLHITFYQNQQTSPYRFLGNYRILVPAGFFTYADGTENEEFEVSFHIPTAKSEILSVKGAELSELKTVSISFPGMSSVSPAATLPVDFAFTYVAEGGDISKAPAVPVTVDDISIDADNVMIRVSDEFKAPGSVELTIPSGSFNVTNQAGVSGTNDLIYLSWNLVTELPVEYNFEISPAPGEYTSFDSEYFASPDRYAYFTIDMPENVTVSGFPSMTNIQLAPANADGTPDLTNSAYTFKAVANTTDNAVYIFDSAYVNGGFAYKKEGSVSPTPGNYILNVPANTFTFKDEVGNSIQSSQLQYNYSIAAPEGGAAYTVTPDFSSSLQAPVGSFRIHFNEASELQWKSTEYVTIANAVTEYVLAPEVDGVDIIVAIPGNGITENGVYTLSIPATALTVDGAPTAVSFQFEVGENPNVGVNGILTDGDDAPVYTLDGVKADASTLSKGIYVTNGKKILKK